MEFVNFIKENLYVVVAALYVLGIFIKAIPKIPNWTIPFILLAVSIPVVMAIMGWDDWPQGLMQGILCAGGAVLVDQSIKQINSARGIDRKETATGSDPAPQI